MLLTHGGTVVVRPAPYASATGLDASLLDDAIGALFVLRRNAQISLMASPTHRPT
jgi:hypothetical protein